MKKHESKLNKRKIIYMGLVATFIGILLSISLSIFKIQDTSNITEKSAISSIESNNNMAIDKIQDFGKEINKLKIENETKIHIKKYKKRGSYESTTISSESSDYGFSKEDSKQEKNDEQIAPFSPSKSIKNGKPKMAIIIDDIATKTQLNEVLNTGLKLTPSVFPISNKNKEMKRAVNNLDFFMVHLPLEAKKYKDDLDTITTQDSNHRIELKIKQIKSMLPNVKYINNHTGSKFTENRNSMDRLLNILETNGIDFLDSRTTTKSAIEEISRDTNKYFLQRDIFIDNELDEKSINKQLRHGIYIAKSRGYAILIGHPHKQTIKALKNARDNILKEVDIIYINELHELINTDITHVSKNNE